LGQKQKGLDFCLCDLSASLTAGTLKSMLSRLKVDRNLFLLRGPVDFLLFRDHRSRSTQASGRFTRTWELVLSLELHVCQVQLIKTRWGASRYYSWAFDYRPLRTPTPRFLSNGQLRLRARVPLASCYLSSEILCLLSYAVGHLMKWSMRASRPSW
jgi:hypothetical protein